MNDFTLSNINAANHAQTCSRAEASILARTFHALEHHLNDPAAIRRARACRQAFETRANESQQLTRRGTNTMKLPTQQALDNALADLARRYNGSRDMKRHPVCAEFYRGYYHGIDVAARDLLRLFNVEREKWDELLDE